jgi:hypothetical protein
MRRSSQEGDQYVSWLFNHIEAIWDDLKVGKAKNRAHFTINRDHIDEGDQLGPPFKAKEHYFQSIINEMFLAKERRWFADYDPMAFVASSYMYRDESETLPLLVGPSMLQQFGQEVPLGMIFQNTPVSGLHPYRGGPLTLTIILNGLQRQNNADKLLQVVESISGAINPSTAFSAYLKIAKTVIDGFKTLLGLQQTIPVVGYHTTINPDIGQVFRPAYFVLIDTDAQQVNQDEFWVRDSRLYYGREQSTAQPYRANDFILFSIAQGDKRTDEQALSFYPLWKATQDLAVRPGQHFWNEAKAQFNTLKRELVNSPDLTKSDSQRLINQYLEELIQLHHETELLGQLAPKQLSDTETELRQIAEELDKL